MLKLLPSGACQQLLISPQVSYLTTLNNVYRSETDNKGTPNTEAEFRPSGWDSIRPRSGLQHYINRKHASSPLCGQQHRQPWAQKWAGTYSHLDLDTSQQLTNELTSLCFCDSTVIRHQSSFKLSRGMNNNTRLTTAEAVLLHCCHVKARLNITNAQFVEFSDSWAAQKKSQSW